MMLNAGLYTVFKVPCGITGRALVPLLYLHQGGGLCLVKSTALPAPSEARKEVFIAKTTCPAAQATCISHCPLG